MTPNEYNRMRVRSTLGFKRMTAHSLAHLLPDISYGVICKHLRDLRKEGLVERVFCPSDKGCKWKYKNSRI